MESDKKPRISHIGMVELGRKLDPKSPTLADWCLLAGLLKFTDDWIQGIESKCLPTGNSPTVAVLRAWQERLDIDQDVPVGKLCQILRQQLKRNDVASIVEKMMKDGTFLDSEVRQPFSGPRTGCHSHVAESLYAPVNSTNNCCVNNPPQPYGPSLRRYWSNQPQENSYHEPSYMNGTQHPGSSHKDKPQNCKSVMSLPDDGEHSSLQRYLSGRQTWPQNRGSIKSNISQEQRFSVHNSLPESNQSIHSLRSISPPEGVMLDTSGASPYQGSSYFISYAYSNYKTAHKLGKLLKDKGHHVMVDTPSSIEDCHRTIARFFNSATYIIIICTPEYIQELYRESNSKLNTRFIFDLMLQEFRHRRTNTRFVPIIEYDRIERNSIPELFRCHPKQVTQYVCNVLRESYTPTSGDVSVQRVVYGSK